jgi:hypothetical protein
MHEWHLHPFSIPRVNCLQYTCVTFLSILHSTCWLLTVYVCDISIHSPFHVLTSYNIRVWHFYPFPFHVLTAYSIRVWHFYPFSIPRVRHLTVYVCDISIHSPFHVLTASHVKRFQDNNSTHHPLIRRYINMIAPRRLQTIYIHFICNIQWRNVPNERLSCTILIKSTLYTYFFNLDMPWGL